MIVISQLDNGSILISFSCLMFELLQSNQLTLER